MVVWVRPAFPHDMSHMTETQEQKNKTPEQIQAEKAKLLADKRESEFNHHLCGFLILLAGIFLLAQDSLKKRWPGVRFIWPACFLLSGLFVLIFSDTEMWPFGSMPILYALQNRPEDLQHKIFAVILLAIGVIELKRAQGKLNAAWSAWVFPVVALAGAILLLFHVHDAGMNGPDAMKIMMHIQNQHRAFAAVGAALALCKGLSETTNRYRGFFGKMWPILMMTLGVLLILYTE